MIFVPVSQFHLILEAFTGHCETLRRFVEWTHQSGPCHTYTTVIISRVGQQIGCVSVSCSLLLHTGDSNCSGEPATSKYLNLKIKLVFCSPLLNNCRTLGPASVWCGVAVTAPCVDICHYAECRTICPGQRRVTRTSVTTTANNNICCWWQCDRVTWSPLSHAGHH